VRTKAFGLLLLAGVVAGCAGRQTPSGLEHGLSPEQWRTDLQVIAAELPRRHANAFHSVTPAAFEAAVAAAMEALPGLDQNSSYLALRRVVALVGDGHTSLQAPPHWRPLPLAFRWFGDPAAAPESLELRVTHVSDEYAAVLGTRVMEIGDATVHGAYQAIMELIAQGESPGSSRTASTWWLRMPPALAGVGIAPAADSIRFVFADDNGQRREHWLRVAPAGTPLRRAAAGTPLPRTRPESPFWFTALPGDAGDSSAVLLVFDEYPSYWRMWRETRALLSAIDRHDANAVIIDLRNNRGGDFNKVRRLLIPALQKRPRISGPDGLFVLIGPVTFSAAMTNAVDLRRELGATLVGEPTGARPNQYQEGRSFTLPNSGLSVSYSTRFYRFQDDDTPGVLPDVHIAPRWEDWAAGRDPAFEWILKRGRWAGR
jgi:hypothetical protein